MIKIIFYKQKDFGRSFTGGIRWQKCYYPSRTHKSELVIGAQLWKWKIGFIIYFKELSEEEQECIRKNW